MADMEKTLNYFTKHEGKLRKAVHAFLYKNGKNKYQTDLYFYPDTKTFYEFTNVGGNSWLNDDHITLYSYNGQFAEFHNDFRKWVNENVDPIVYDIIEKLKHEIEYERD